MAGYRRLATRRLMPGQDIELQHRIVLAKLKSLVGKPNVHQKMLIESVTPLIVQLFAWRQEYLKTGQLPGKYPAIFSNVKSTIQQLIGSARKAKGQTETEENTWSDLF